MKSRSSEKISRGWLTKVSKCNITIITHTRLINGFSFKKNITFRRISDYVDRQIQRNIDTAVRRVCAIFRLVDGSFNEQVRSIFALRRVPKLHAVRPWRLLFIRYIQVGVRIHIFSVFTYVKYHRVIRVFSTDRYYIHFSAYFGNNEMRHYQLEDIIENAYQVTSAGNDNKKLFDNLKYRIVCAGEVNWNSFKFEYVTDEPLNQVSLQSLPYTHYKHFLMLPII